MANPLENLVENLVENLGLALRPLSLLLVLLLRFLRPALPQFPRMFQPLQAVLWGYRLPLHPQEVLQAEALLHFDQFDH